jgi:hypothetical protein
MSVVAICIAFAALLVSAASLWRSVLKPATIDLDFLPEGTAVAGGGQSGLPTFGRVTMQFLLSNVGAQAGVVKGIEISSVRAVGAEEMAQAAVAPNGQGKDPEIRRVGEKFPAGISAGEVWPIEVQFGLAGTFATEAGTQRLNPEEAPAREDFARLLNRLSEISVEVRCRYRRGPGLFGASDRAVDSRVVIPAAQFRSAAAAYWRANQREDLADLVDSHPRG